ncbi:hypothetical protein [Frondihabitans sp. PhB188]|uniref:hypothetical protein n=1 Tax=Frondihabitans sp. PhB188 TaxID=2485200 RepID=UPI000F464AA3|nr:hypothetical protein [Frondihabitans sp. PhB188]
MSRYSRARLVALVTAGVVVAAGVGAGSSAVASTNASTPGVTTTAVGNFPSGEAVSPDNKWLYVTSSSYGTVSVIDVHTKKLVGTISVPGATDVAFSRTGRHAYVLARGYVRIIDAATRKVTGRVADPSGSAEARLESNGRYLLLTRDSHPGAALFDTLTNMVAVLPDGPTGFAEQYSASGATSYGLDFNSVADATTFVRSSTSTGAVLSRSTSWPSKMSQEDLAVASDGSVAAVIEPLRTGGVSDDDRVLDIIDAHSATVRRTVTIPAANSFRNLAVTPDGSAVIVRLGSGLTVVDAATGHIRGEIDLAGPTSAWHYSPDGRFVFVVSVGPATNGGSVDQIALATASVVRHIKVGNDPLFALPSVTGKTVYVPNYRDGTVSQVSMTTTGFHATLRQDWGSDRYGSAVVESRLTNSTDRSATYITSDADPALMLGLAAVSGRSRSNQFLVIPRTGPSAAAIAEIGRVDRTWIYVVGDESIVSASAFATLRNKFGNGVRRIAGSDATATLLDVEATPETSSGQIATTVYVADRDSYAAALAGPSAAATSGADFVLVDGSASSLPASVTSYLTSAGRFPDPLAFVVLGNETTVSSGIASQLAGLGTVKRYGGSDRYAIAAALNADHDSAPASVVAVNGGDVVDAAMGATRARGLGGTVDLVHSDCVPAEVVHRWTAGPAVSLTLLGSPSQLGLGVVAARACP